MSKNIVIQEGGISKQMTVNKLKTDKVEGGTCLWVPEDEVSLGTKSINTNGTYKASDDGKYGFSQVTVNVSGAQGSVNPDGTPNVNPVNPNDPDSKVNPGGPGTSVVGTDPVTGNDYIIGVDEDGQLVTTPVPSVIEIIENPTKTDYNDGDTVDPTGLVAVLKNNDGTVFTNEDYPDGTIPISELLLPTTNVDADETTEGGMTSELETNIPQPIHVIPAGTPFMQEYEDHNDPRYRYWYYKLPMLLFSSTGDNSRGARAIPLSTNYNNDYYLYSMRQDGEHREGGSNSAVNGIVRNGKTAYYSLENFGSYKLLVDYYTIFPDENSIWAAVYGQLSGAIQQLPVQWKSPYDGRTLETSYQVTVDGSGSESSNYGGTFTYNGVSYTCLNSARYIGNGYVEVSGFQTPYTVDEALSLGYIS